MLLCFIQNALFCESFNFYILNGIFTNKKNHMKNIVQFQSYVRSLLGKNKNVNSLLFCLQFGKLSF